MSDIDKALLGKEWDRLINGITKTENNINNSRSILYTTVAAIIVLAFGSDTNESLFFLTPFIVIIPMYLLCLVSLSNMHRLAAYQIVFIESITKELNWETRLCKLYSNVGERYRQKYFNHYSLPFLSTAIICLVLFFYKLLFIEKDLSPIVYNVKFSIGSILCLIMIRITTTQKTPLELKNHYIEQWTIVKQLEE